MNMKKISILIACLITLAGCQQKGKVEEKPVNSDTNVMESQTFKLESAIDQLKNIKTINDIKEDKISLDIHSLEFKPNQVLINDKDLEINGFDLQNRHYSVSILDLKTKHVILIIGDIGKPKDATGLISAIELYPNGTYKKIRHAQSITIATSPIELVESSVKVNDKNNELTFEITSKDGKDSSKFSLKDRELKQH